MLLPGSLEPAGVPVRRSDRPKDSHPTGRPTARAGRMVVSQFERVRSPFPDARDKNHQEDQAGGGGDNRKDTNILNAPSWIRAGFGDGPPPQPKLDEQQGEQQTEESSGDERHGRRLVQQPSDPFHRPDVVGHACCHRERPGVGFPSARGGVLGLRPTNAQISSVPRLGPRWSGRPRFFPSPFAGRL